MTLFKILGWLIVCVVLLAIGLVVAIPQFVDPNDYKAEITQFVKEKTGRDLNLAGDLGLSFYPWLGLTTGAVTLSQREGFGDKPMLEVGGAKIKAKLLPLLKKEIEVDKVLLDQPRLRLRVNDNGENNWSDLVGAVSSGGDVSTDANPAAAGAGIAALAINGVEIADGFAEWQDDKAGKRYEISDLQLETGTITPGKPVQARVSFTLNGTGVPADTKGDLEAQVLLDAAQTQLQISGLAASVSAKELSAKANASQLDIDLPAGQVKASGVKIDGDFQDQSVEAGLENLSFDTNNQALAFSALEAKGAYMGQDIALSVPNGDMNLNAGSLAIPQLDAQIAQGVLKASVNGENMLSAPNLAGDINVSGIDLRSLLDALSVDLSKLPEGLLRQVSLTGAYQTDLNNLTLNNFDLDIDGNQAAGSVSIKDFSTPNIVGDISGSQIKLRELLRTFEADVEGVPDDLLQAAVLIGTFSSDFKNADVKDLDLKVDGMVLTGDLGVRDFGAPGYRFNLALNELNADKYFPASESESGEGSAENDDGATGALLPVAALQGLDAAGKLRVGKLITSGVTMTKVALDINAAQGKVEIKPLDAALYGGSANINAQYDAVGDSPSIDVNKKFKNLDVGALLKASGVTDRFQGKGSMNVDFNARGQDQDAVLKSSKGNLDLVINNGQIQGVNILETLVKARADIDQFKGKERKVETGNTDKTEFSEMRTSFVIDDGVARSKDLSIKSQLFAITGKGAINIIDATLDYRLLVKVAKTGRAQDSKDLSELEGLEIPVRVKGPVDAPEYYVDVAMILKARLDREIEKEKAELKAKLDAEKAELEAKIEREKQEAQAELDRKIEEKKEKLKDKINKKLGDKLKSLFD